MQRFIAIGLNKCLQRLGAPSWVYHVPVAQVWADKPGLGCCGLCFHPPQLEQECCATPCCLLPAGSGVACIVINVAAAAMVTAHRSFLLAEKVRASVFPMLVQRC